MASRCRIQNYFCKGLRFYFILDNVIMIIRNAIVHSKVNIEPKLQLRTIYNTYKMLMEFNVEIHVRMKNENVRKH